MDTLSLTVGILTMLGVGGQVAKEFGKIRALKYAPRTLLAVNNGVAEIGCLINDIDDFPRQHEEVNKIPTRPRVCRALGRVRETLLALEELIACELATIDRTNGRVKLD